ncbi:hypothetical protein MLD38_026136 [Melastoma candidum]|uniref:Uncharacterized protein n=1 Tax=Melastoma candidum TaxID=119954 RepID=A0ACB9NYM2_9MYRT|nr:hypothetical protein MLD38_026136 [Melastoma candidum]
MHGGRRFGPGGEVGKGRGRSGCKQHMRTVPPRVGVVGVAAAVDGDGSSSSSVTSSSPNSFFKVISDVLVPCPPNPQTFSVVLE